MPVPTSDVSVTPRAARRIAAILKDEVAGAMLRVSVKGGGCSGFQYAFEVEPRAATDDLSIVQDGVTVLVDPTSLPFLKGAAIDFVDDLMGASFRVNNPNATVACGCGTSFSI
ncbi:MAG TPA: iron-sulfur cluster insertion protein ErpA [Beijerinckiaceae bacterium]|nr:iron-sulfur cluster insertion protein ErpA [Beijerinckiaceae bacterium]